MKSAGAPFVILLLLAATACRQPGAGADNGAADAGAVAADGGRPSVDHDPRAMTAIDVATGDLSGFANFAGGRAWAPQPHSTASLGQLPEPAPETANSVAAVPSDSSPSAMPLLEPPPPTENSATGAPAAGTGEPTP